MKSIIPWLIVVCSVSYGQNFLNGDLEGTIVDWESVPDYWEWVPYDAPYNEAAVYESSSPDMLYEDIFLDQFGMSGVPYSGHKFISGVHADLNPGFMQEGIMQTVSGFTPGHFYEIKLYQSVVKQPNARDTSGSWAVYMDHSLLEITQPTISHRPWGWEALEWEERMILFQAEDTIHTFGFLPLDDDSNHNRDDFDKGAALRMGIDSISLGYSHCELPDVNLGCDTAYCEFDHNVPIVLTNDYTSYTWHDGSTDNIFIIENYGIYWVEAENNCGRIKDSIIISERDCRVDLYVPNCFTPNGDGINDVFKPIHYNLQSLHIIIYNRKGEVVYNEEGLGAKWDGKYKGALLVDDVYNYSISYSSEFEGEKIIRGHVTLLK